MLGTGTRYLRGLWLSGLRLCESLRLSWDRDSPFAVDPAGKRPVFRIEARAQKARRWEVMPMVPEFAALPDETPLEQRHGLVFLLQSSTTGRPLTPHSVGVIVSDIGKKAEVLTNKDEQRFTTSHDLRRSFGARWARRVMPAVLKRLMRHANIATTMTYCVDLDAMEVADDLWERYGPISDQVNRSGNTSGNTDSQSP